MKLVFIFLLLFILGGCRNRVELKDPEVYYTCSMDPQVISDVPGKCPICKMELTAVKRSSVENTDDIQLSEQQMQLGNIQTDTIETGNIGNEIVLTGILNLNAAKINSVSARIMGRIERLYVKNQGDYVSMGKPLYELYSEELNNVKQEYILALDRRKLFSGQSAIDFDEIIEAARNKLRLWGMSEAQVRDLEDRKQAPLTTTFYSSAEGFVTAVNVIEGGYVMQGETMFQLADLSSLWAEAQVYATQLSQVPRGAKAKVQLPELGLEFDGRIEFANPELAQDSRINLVRITIPNRGNRLKPGMPAYITIKTDQHNSLQLPTDAVIREKRGATVWLKTGNNTFRSKMVTTGLESDGLVEITYGLKPGDIIVVSGAYLLHSEFIFKRGADPMTGHEH